MQIIPNLLTCAQDAIIRFTFVLCKVLQLRVRVQCAIAVIKFCESAKRKVLEPHLQQIVSQISPNLSSK